MGRDRGRSDLRAISLLNQRMASPESRPTDCASPLVGLLERVSGGGSGVTPRLPSLFQRNFSKKVCDVIPVLQPGIDVTVVWILGCRRRRNRSFTVREDGCLAGEPTVEMTWLLSPCSSVGVVVRSQVHAIRSVEPVRGYRALSSCRGEQCTYFSPRGRTPFL